MQQTTLLFFLVFLTAKLFGQNVHIPDVYFKSFLTSGNWIDSNNDNEIQFSEAASFDGVIDCSFGNISDLTGIEAFTSLKELECYYNQITNIDLSQNTALTRLGCGHNQLININLNGATALTSLSCGSNQLTSLNVSHNTALTMLYCGDNQLTSLDLTQNIGLTFLNCSHNPLMSLDVTQNNALVSMWCKDNELTNLDVSQNIALTHLGCWYNQLTSLDVSKNTALTFLGCNYNQLVSLDVSQNSNLDTLWCRNNELTCLNLSNGNNQNIELIQLQFNPDLICVEVDDAVWSTSNWTDIDSHTTFSEKCFIECPSSKLKKIIQIVDLMGRETTFRPNTPLIYVYDDGSTEIVFTIE